MKRLALLLIFVLLLSFSVFAQEKKDPVEINVMRSENKITANDAAIFEIVISNNQLRNTDFFIAKNFFSERWKVTAQPYILSVESGFSRNVQLRVAPSKYLVPGEYKLIVGIESRDGSFKEELPLEIEIVPFGEDNIRTELVVDDKIDPRIGSVVRIELENLFNFDINDVSILFESDLFEFEKNIKLKANEKRVEKFELSFPADVKLGQYEFNVVVKSGKDLLGSANKKVLLAPYSEVTEKIFRSNKFNKNIVITKENTGTEESSEEVNLELTWIEKVLARYNIAPESVNKADGKYIARWFFSIEPGERFDIIVNLPYGTYLSILLITLLLIYIIFYITRRKVVLVKKIIDVTKDSEGIKGVKIILHLTNRGNKSIEKIRIIDYLPKMVAASGKDFGTMKPTRTQKSMDGKMRLVWDLDGLDRGEERIISYIARSTLSIIGKMLLPEAVVEYQAGRKHVHVRSNKLTLLTKATEKEKRSH